MAVTNRVEYLNGIQQAVDAFVKSLDNGGDILVSANILSNSVDGYGNDKADGYDVLAGSAKMLESFLTLFPLSSNVKVA